MVKISRSPAARIVVAACIGLVATMLTAFGPAAAGAATRGGAAIRGSTAGHPRFLRPRGTQPRRDAQRSLFRRPLR